jgi:alanyl-tRNA synthetase
MQRTEKYFEQDAFRTECESVILAAEPDEKTGGGRIALGLPGAVSGLQSRSM